MQESGLFTQIQNSIKRLCTYCQLLQHPLTTLGFVHFLKSLTSIFAFNSSSSPEIVKLPTPQTKSKSVSILSAALSCFLHHSILKMEHQLEGKHYVETRNQQKDLRVVFHVKKYNITTLELADYFCVCEKLWTHQRDSYVILKLVQSSVPSGDKGISLFSSDAGGEMEL